MATNKKDKKDLFKNTLSVKKPSDKKIEAVTTDISKDAVQSEKGYHIQFPLDDYNKLNAVSKKTHIPMKYIIIAALNAYYEQNGY